MLREGREHLLLPRVRQGVSLNTVLAGVLKELVETGGGSRTV